MTDYLLIVLIAMMLWVLSSIGNLTRKIKHIMATLQERFDQIDADLTEASSELAALIQGLRDELANAGTVLSPEAEAKLASIESKAKGLAEVVPNTA